ncbi:MAG: hypothetical protein H6712_26980 [Myxococcales bacterium]|nr:hypothetical protein [Myxococcales bacterium]MCB9717521.1 hypothetical protein [Myxococcales bacterium]
MTHRLLAMLTSLALMPACLFDPDIAGDDLADSSGDDGEDQSGEGNPGEPNACLEVEQPCSVGPDCCNYDPDFPPGSTQCVQVDQVAACTTICLEPDDCASGCCAALEGIQEYGACVDASVCNGG